MQNKIKTIAQSGILLAAILAVQIVGLPNPLTGTAVNAFLVFALLLNGLKSGLTLACISPVGGVISGHLPVPLLPVIPVIICGNCILLLVYSRFRYKGVVCRVILPALLKALFIGGLGIFTIRILGIDAAGWLLVPVLGLQFLTASMGIILSERIYPAVVSGIVEE